MLGPGKYDDLCTKARQEAEAAGAILLLMDGNKGTGFSAQLTLDHMFAIPGILRQMADQIEKDQASGTV